MGSCESLLKRGGLLFVKIAVVVCICFLILEIVLRKLHVAPCFDHAAHYKSDPYLPYILKPGSTIYGTSSLDGYTWECKHNSFGLRDVEHSLTKKQGVFRILGLGDSFTYGWGAQFEHTYLYLLEKLLNERKGTHQPIEIIKAGIPGFFPETERIFLEHYGMYYLPDLIIIGFLPNDIIDTYYGTENLKVDELGYLKTQEGARLGKVAHFLFLHSHVFRIALRHYTSYKSGRGYLMRWNDVYDPKKMGEKMWCEVESEYKKIADIAHACDIPLVIVHIPQRGPWGQDHAYPAQRLSQWCVSNNVEFIDVLPAMSEASVDTDLYYKKNKHCRPEGYRIIADVLYEGLMRRGLVP